MKKEIVFFDGTMLNGGAERVISVLANKMIEVHEKVTILTYFRGESFYSLSKKIKKVSVQEETKTNHIFKNISWMRNYFKKNASLVISFVSSFNILAIIATRGLNIPIIVSERTDPKRDNFFFRIVRNCLYSMADGIVAQTMYAKHYFEKRIHRVPVFVVCNPIDLHGKEGLALKTPKENLIVSVGRLIEVKRHDILIDAFASLHSKYPDYKLLILGEGDFRKKLEDKINGYGLSQFVLLPGSVQNVFEMISPARIFVLSSEFEGMPNALFEAMCLGLPVISTRLPAAVELIENQNNGILFNINNKEELVSSIDNLLANNDFQLELGNNALKIIEKVSVDSVMGQWEKIIQKYE